MSIRLDHILIRFHRNGAIGAHRGDILELVDAEGNVLAAAEQAPVPLAIEDLDGLMSEQNAELVAGVAAADAARIQAEQTAQALGFARDEALQKLSTIQKSLDLMTSEWGAATRRIVALEAELAAATTPPAEA